MPINRLVVLLTPLAATAAGGIAAWVANHFPGVEIDKDSLTEIFVAGIAVTFAGSAHWLHGFQKWEAREAEAARGADVADDELLQVAGDERSVMPPEAEDLAGDADDDLLDAAPDPLVDEDMDEEEEEDESLLEPTGAGAGTGP